MEQASLFDDGQRTRHEFARYSESDFSFLNSSAWPEAVRVRGQLEEWFGRYPAAAEDPVRERRDLRGRLRSTRDIYHAGAFFELVLHELLLKLDCRLEVHPRISVSGNRPDFLVTPLIGAPFYLEAVVATGESKEEAAAKARLNQVYDLLNRLESPNFFIHVRVDGKLQVQPPVGRLRRFLEKQLSALDPDEMTGLLRQGLDSLPSWHWQHEGCRFVFQPIPITKTERRGGVGHRPVGSTSEGAKMIDPRTPLRDAIMAKAERLKGLEAPLVIAVNALDSFVDRDAILEALFGREAIRVRALDVGSSEPEPFRILDGAFTTPSGPRYRRVSGVLIAQSLNHWSIGSAADLCLYHNPYAARPLGSELDRLRRAVPQDGVMRWEDGDGLASLLELPMGWP